MPGGHFQTGRGPTGINYVTASQTIYDTPFVNLGQVPPVFNTTGDPAFHGIPAQIGTLLQSYTDNSQLNAGAAGYPWALDTNTIASCGGEVLYCGYSRPLNRVAADIYRIGAIGSTMPSNATYKIQPMVGWAGRFQLKDVSGRFSSVDSTPYSMCYAFSAGECHGGSATGEIYVNVPVAYDPGYCVPSISWVNVSCVLFGSNAPAGGIRQFRINQWDSNGAYSRFISNGWSSVGRHNAYSHATAYQDGQWAMLMGTNLVDGYNFMGFMISMPPWVESQTPANDFRSLLIQAPSGLPYAQVRFGYSRYIGPMLHRAAVYTVRRVRKTA